MKNLFFKGWLVLSLLVGCTVDAYSQYFLAGRHNTGNYYFDIDPDTTLTGPNVHAVPLPAAIFDIDINGDGVKDFYLYSYGSWINGTGYSKITINGSNPNSQIAFGYSDTCHTPNSTYHLFRIAKSLRKNDTINDNLEWRNDSALYLTYTEWLVNPYYSCNHSGFNNDTLGNYLGVRLIRPLDTIYGWIKITNINFLTFAVQEFASSKNCTGIDEQTAHAGIYPIPTRNIVTIETPFPGYDLNVYNQYGMKLLQKRGIPTKTQLDLSGKANGIYIIKLFKASAIILKKIIKQ